ncbi:hypothetical protein O181_032332 [Austropuccinia psidii MF-1]|uniref:Uncharacterized protein n=1 Tax=Austropuccinia psidii MF-1 TaxID=1389203 RepID=A0A9Q3D2E0_9BASI|nr:hypothetical protein [Austropuccinia psidii MF-1]
MQSVKKSFKIELEVSINRFKSYADKSNESPPVSNPDDMVWLSSKKIKQTRPTKKLSETWLGPSLLVKMSLLTHTISSSYLNGIPASQSSIFPSLNQSIHQQSKIGIKILLLQSSLKKNRNEKSLSYWMQTSREEDYGILWNRKVSVKTQKDLLGNPPKTSIIALNFQ